jgi:hypothetical protein
MKMKHMGVACYSILLVAVAIVGIQLTSLGSVSAQEEESAQSGPGVFPRIASVDDNAAFTNSAEIADGASGREGVEGTGNSVDGAGNSVDGAGNSVDGTGNSVDGAGNSVDGAGNGFDGRDVAGTNGRDGTGIDGNAGADGGRNGEEGLDDFGLEIEAIIP